MITKYDLSEDGIKRFEQERLLYTIDEMLSMDNKRRWAELTAITHFEDWINDDKKVNTVQTLAFLTELDKGQLSCSFGIEKTFIEQYFIVKWAKEGMPTIEITKKIRREPNTVRRILILYGIKAKTNTPSKTVVVITYDNQRIEFPSAKKAADSEWCDVAANTLRSHLAIDKKHFSDKAIFYYKEDERE